MVFPCKRDEPNEQSSIYHMHMDVSIFLVFGPGNMHAAYGSFRSLRQCLLDRMFENKHTTICWAVQIIYTLDSDVCIYYMLVYFNQFSLCTQMRRCKQKKNSVNFETRSRNTYKLNTVDCWPYQIRPYD